MSDRVRVERLDLDGDPAAIAARLRALAPAAASVEAGVAQIVRAVRERGDHAVRELTERWDTAGRPAPPLRVSEVELTDALATLDDAVRDGLELALANVGALARASAQSADRELVLPQGQRVLLRHVPVARAAVYVPGGRAPYPSTVVMGAVTARAAAVEQVAVCAPPGREGSTHQVILAACALCGVQEVYRMGGAQAVAALALGTQSVPRVDVLVGPGNLWVQEAKRQLSGVVGIDGFAGPSDLFVIASEGAAADLVALDLLAQAEHGPESVVVAASDERAVLDEVAQAIGELAPRHPTVAPAAVVLVATAQLADALALAEAFAPEHLQLVGAAAEALAGRIRSAGCVLVGAASGTAFSDYVAGSNHILPTGGAARFASALGPMTFRRRVAEVHIGDGARALASAAAPVARAEGFPVHALSMQARIGRPPGVPGQRPAPAVGDNPA